MSSCRDDACIVFSPTGFQINLHLTLSFESGFTGFRGLWMTSSVWIGGNLTGTFYTTFHRRMDTSLFFGYNLIIYPINQKNHKKS